LNTMPYGTITGDLKMAPNPALRSSQCLMHHHSHESVSSRQAASSQTNVRLQLQCFIRCNLSRTTKVAYPLVTPSSSLRLLALL
jgi:hypothetical protein